MSRYEHDGLGNLTLIASASESVTLQTEGHVITDGTTDFPARSGLEFSGEGVAIENNTQDDTTKVTIPTASKMNTNGSNASSEVTFDGSFTVGDRRATSNIGRHSVAMGEDNSAIGDYSQAEGYGVAAEGMFSHAEGYLSNAKEAYSFAGGYRGHTGESIGYLGNTIKRVAKYPKFAFGMMNGHYGATSSYNYADGNSYNVFSIADRGSIFTTGERTLARGYTDVLVADGPRIVLEDGACYILVCNGRNKTNGAWRGAISYLIEATFNPLGTGTSTTAQAVPHIATLGTIGTTPCKLATETEAYVNGAGTTVYHSKLGIGSCTTALGTRWNLYKVLGSEEDFGSGI